MPRIPIPPEPPDKVFSLATPADMLMKLQWGIRQLRGLAPADMVNFHHPAYHAFNCAVTAWHISDWVWQSIDDEGRGYILSKFAVTARKTKEGAFSHFR